jgi:hypothetical protein
MKLKLRKHFLSNKNDHRNTIVLKYTRQGELLLVGVFFCVIYKKNIFCSFAFLFLFVNDTFFLPIKESTPPTTIMALNHFPSPLVYIRINFASYNNYYNNTRAAKHECVL